MNPKKGENYYEFKGINPTQASKVHGFLDIEFPYDEREVARVWLHQDRSKEFSPGSASIIANFHELQNLMYGITGRELTDLQQ